MSKTESKNYTKFSWYGRAGEWVKNNQADIAIFIGFILVAVIAFGAGRLSAPEIVRNPVIIEEPDLGPVNLYGAVSQSVAGEIERGGQIIGSEIGLFVGSKNSNKYHWPWCAPAKNIKPENQVWFQSEAQAQAAGYLPGSCVEKEAPAGYRK